MNGAHTRRTVITNGVEVEFKPKCIVCGNTRTFTLIASGETVTWTAGSPAPAGARPVMCGKCRSRNSLIMDYSD